VSGVDRYDQAEVEQLLKLAARIMGRAGGLARTPAKQAAARQNGMNGGGGRPRHATPSKMAQYQRNHRARVKAAKAAAGE
jgi:hypothetical protein